MAGVGSTFASRYHIDRLVHHEEFRDIRDAIHREKEIKAWRREKKLKLIESQNVGWIDLAARILSPEASGEVDWPHEASDMSRRRPVASDVGALAPVLPRMDSNHL